MAIAVAREMGLSSTTNTDGLASPNRAVNLSYRKRGPARSVQERCAPRKLSSVCG